MPRSSCPSLDETRAVFRLLGDVRDLRADRTAWERMMVERLCGLVGARQGSCLRVGQFEPNAIPVFQSVTHAGWVNQPAVRLWEELLRAGRTAADPLLIRAARVTGDVVTVLRPQLITDDEWDADPVAREMRSLGRIETHSIGWCRLAPGGVALTLRFQCDARGGRPASPRQRNLLRLFLDEFHQLWHAGKMAPHAPADAAAAEGSANLPHLSPRERQVLDLLLAGDTVKGAAAHLLISHRTVEGHVKVLHRKFGVSSRGELLARCLKKC